MAFDAPRKVQDRPCLCRTTLSVVAKKLQGHLQRLRKPCLSRRSFYYLGLRPPLWAVSCWDEAAVDPASQHLVGVLVVTRRVEVSEALLMFWTQCSVEPLPRLDAISHILCSEGVSCRRLLYPRAEAGLSGAELSSLVQLLGPAQPSKISTWAGGLR